MKYSYRNQLFIQYRISKYGTSPPDIAKGRSILMER